MMIQCVIFEPLIIRHYAENVVTHMLHCAETDF